MATLAATELLPPPRKSGGPGLNAVIARRRSIRDFGPDPLSPEKLSQLLWAAQGVTGEGEERTAPSPGGLYPLVIHVLSDQGVHRYVPDRHRLDRVTPEDRRQRVAHACLEQECVATAPLVLVLGTMRRRARGRYGARAARYAMLEAGHVAQNVLLTAVALGLGGVPVGAFYDLEVRREAAFRTDVEPVYVLALGRPAPP